MAEMNAIKRSENRGVVFGDWLVLSRGLVGISWFVLYGVVTEFIVVPISLTRR